MNIFINQIAHMLLAKEKKTKNGEEEEEGEAKASQLHDLLSAHASVKILHINVDVRDGKSKSESIFSVTKITVHQMSTDGARQTNVLRSHSTSHF